MRRGVVIGLLVASAALLNGQLALADPGEYPPEGGTVEVDPAFVTCGAKVTSTGSNWQPGGVISFRIGEEILGTVPTAADGTFTATFEVPEGLGLGDHVITAQGNDPSGNPQQVKTTVTIVECGTETAGIAEFRGGTARGALPYTGSDQTGLLVGIGVTLTLLGIVLVAVFTRRRSMRAEGP